MKVRHIHGANSSQTESDSGHSTKPKLLSIVRLVTHQSHIILVKENFSVVNFTIHGQICHMSLSPVTPFGQFKLLDYFQPSLTGNAGQEQGLSISCPKFTSVKPYQDWSGFNQTERYVQHQCCLGSKEQVGFINIIVESTIYGQAHHKSLLSNDTI